MQACATVGEARKAVDDYLKKWEILIGLEDGPEDLRFDFQDWKIIDRNPPPKESGSGALNINVWDTVRFLTSVGSVALQVSRNAYPSRPVGFAFSPDVETMYVRYKAFKEGREPLLSMANMCLAVLEESTRAPKNKRREAENLYNISFKVLNTLGRFCATKGNSLQARKPPSAGIYEPLTHRETEWILAVVKRMIRRAGEYAYDPQGTLKKITMEDFPALS